MIETDVVVIGAGPSGSTAAKHAALGGAQVILIDKKSEIGTPKRCAEGIYETGLKWLDIKPDERWIAQTIYGGVIHAPDGNDFVLTSEDINLKGYILERKIFDKHMAMDAIRAGSKIMIKTLVTDVKRKTNGFEVLCNSIEGNFTINTKLVICADGCESTIAKKVGIESTTQENMMSCAQFEMCNVDCYGDNDNIEFFIGNDIAKGGYAWIFPKGNQVANVGIGISGSSDETVYNALLDFIEKCPATKNAQAVELNIGGDPINGLVEKIYDDNIMICGDAAGQVNPIEGGGIILGMLGGMAAGKVAASSIKEQDYSKEKLHEYYIEFNKLSHSVVEKLPEARDIIFSLSDKDYNKLVDVANNMDIKNISKTDILKASLKLSPRLSYKISKLFKILL